MSERGHSEAKAWSTGYLLVINHWWLEGAEAGPWTWGMRPPVIGTATLATLVICEAIYSVLRALLPLSHLPHKPILHMGGEGGPETGSNLSGGHTAKGLTGHHSHPDLTLKPTLGTS